MTPQPRELTSSVVLNVAYDYCPFGRCYRDLFHTYLNKKANPKVGLIGLFDTQIDEFAFFVSFAKGQLNTLNQVLQLLWI